MANFDPSTVILDAPAPKKRFDPLTVKLDAAPTPDEVAAKQAELTRSYVPDIAAQQRAKAEQLEISARRDRSREEENLIKQNAEPGTPLRTRKELDATLRARLSAEPDPAVQAKMLNDQGIPARLAKDKKNVIVRRKGDDGKDEDVLVHPFGAPTLGTIAGEAVPIAKTAANVGLAFVNPPLALRNVARPLLAQAATMGLGAAAVEGASTGGSRVLAGQPLGDTGERAMKEGAIEGALPLALNRAGAAGTWTLSKLGGAEATEQATKRAAKALDLPLTGSMARDSQVLRGAERGAGTTRFDEEQGKALFAMRDKVQRPTDTPVGPLAQITDADVASKVQPIFATADEAASSVVRNEMTAAEKAAAREIRAALDAGIAPTMAKNSDVGRLIRDTIAGKGPNSKATQLRKGDEELFSKVNDLATEEGLVIKTSNIEKLAGELSGDDKKALMALTPGIQKIPKISQILTTGEPDAGAKVALYGADNKLLADAGEVVAPPPLTLLNARELRRTVYNMAHDPGAPGQAGVTKEQLMRFYHAIDADMNETVAKEGSSALKSANETAEKFHKENIQPLQQSDVAKLFKETDSAGRIGDNEIVERLFRGKGDLDALRSYRNVLGKDSPEWKLLVRQGLETVLDDAGARIGRVDASVLLKRINQLSEGELADEIIGPVVKAVRDNATLMARAQGVKIPKDELDDALTAAPAAISDRLKRAIEREIDYQREFMGSTQKMLRDGVLTPRTMGKPEDFVQRFIFDGTAGPADVRQALTQISAAADGPASVEMLRRRTMARILEDTRMAVKKGEVSNESIDVQKLRDYVQGSAGENARVVMGRDATEFLDQLLTYAVANERRGRLIGESTSASVPAGDIAGRGAAAAIGHKISLARLAADAIANVPTYVVGKASDLSPGIRRYLATGELPAFGAFVKGKSGVTDQAAQGAVLALPPAGVGASRILSDTENSREKPPANPRSVLSDKNPAQRMPLAK